MIFYWLLFLTPVLAALGERKWVARAGPHYGLLALLVPLFVVMALRSTCGDFITYVIMFERIEEEASLAYALSIIEPGYGLLNWLSAELGLSIYGVNAVCAFIVVYVLYRFAYREPYPLLFLALAMPYLVIVVAMGYTRQGVAISFVMMALLYLREGKLLKPALAFLCAGMFHTSAFMVAPLIVMSPQIGRGPISLFPRIMLLVGGSALIFYYTSETFTYYFDAYVAREHYQSSGALLRTAVTAVAAVIFLIYRRSWQQQYNDDWIWKPFAFLAFISVPLAVTESTATDRVGLYLLPFQLVVMTRLMAFEKQALSAQAVKCLVILAYCLYFYTWLHHGAYVTTLWVPFSWGQPI